MSGFPWGPKKSSPTPNEAKPSAPAPLKDHVFPNGGMTGGEVVQILLDRGYRAELNTDSDGDPIIKSATEGIKYFIRFYNGKGERYAALQFGAAFNSEGQMTVERIMEWNKTRRFGRAYLDQVNDPVIEMDVDVERGFTPESLSNNLERWEAVLPSFRKYVFPPKE